MALFPPLGDETQRLESVYSASAHNRFRTTGGNGVSPRRVEIPGRAFLVRCLWVNS